MTEPLTVVFQRRATREIEEVDEWWRANRPSAPDLFITELERMLAAVAMMPTLGTPARSQRAQGVHRILLRKTRYHVYYRTRGDTLEVLAVWHAVRGAGPGL
jgi:plasmid stabilization system protein ParE